MPKLQMLRTLTFTFFVYSLISSTMAKWLVMPSLNYTGDFAINTDYEESFGDPKTYYIEILTSVLHSKKAAEKAFIIDYINQGTTEYGFQATLSNDQANSLSVNPHVHSVVGLQTRLPVNIKRYVIYTEKPDKDLLAYYTEILKSSLGSEERVKEAGIYNFTGQFTALLPDRAVPTDPQNDVYWPSKMLYTRTS